MRQFLSQKTLKKYPHTKVDGKPVYFESKKNLPSMNILKDTYSKINDSRKIPVVFETKKQYLQEYIKNQEAIKHYKFPQQQKQKYIRTELKDMSGVVSRYTTKKNKYIEPRVVLFTDKKLPPRQVVLDIYHEYGHEVWEKSPKLRKTWSSLISPKTSPTPYGRTDKEEDFADSFAYKKAGLQIDQSRSRIIQDKCGKNYIPLPSKKEIEDSKKEQEKINTQNIENWKKEKREEGWYDVNIPRKDISPKLPANIGGLHKENKEKLLILQKKFLNSNREKEWNERLNQDNQSQQRKLFSSFFKKKSHFSLVRDFKGLNEFRGQDFSKATAAKRFGGRNINRLQKIGAGRDRTVYALDQNKVLKVAKNPTGLMQNNEELYLESPTGLKHYETGADYAVMERAQPPGKATQDMLRKLKKTNFRENPNFIDTSTLETAGVDSEYGNYDLAKGDFLRKKNWGEKDGQPVLIDAGTLSRRAIDKSNIGEDEKREWQKIQQERRFNKQKGPEPVTTEQDIKYPEAPEALQSLELPVQDNQSGNMTLFHHTTDKLRGHFIRKEGLKPHQDLSMGGPTQSEFSKRDEVYLFKEKKDANMFKQSMEQSKGALPQEVITFDVPPHIEKKMQEDRAPGMKTFSAYKYKGSIPAQYIVEDDGKNNSLQQHNYNKQFMTNPTFFVSDKKFYGECDDCGRYKYVPHKEGVKKLCDDCLQKKIDVSRNNRVPQIDRIIKGIEQNKIDVDKVAFDNIEDIVYLRRCGCKNVEFEGQIVPQAVAEQQLHAQGKTIKYTDTILSNKCAQDLYGIEGYSKSPREKCN